MLGDSNYEQMRSFAYDWTQIGPKFDHEKLPPDQRYQGPLPGGKFAFRVKRARAYSFASSAARRTSSCWSAATIGTTISAWLSTRTSPSSVSIEATTSP